MASINIGGRGFQSIQSSYLAPSVFNLVVVLASVWQVLKLRDVLQSSTFGDAPVGGFVLLGMLQNFRLLAVTSFLAASGYYLLQRNLTAGRRVGLRVATVGAGLQLFVVTGVLIGGADGTALLVYPPGISASVSRGGNTVFFVGTLLNLSGFLVWPCWDAGSGETFVPWEARVDGRGDLPTTLRNRWSVVIVGNAILAFVSIPTMRVTPLSFLVGGFSFVVGVLLRPVLGIGLTVGWYSAMLRRAPATPAGLNVGLSAVTVQLLSSVLALFTPLVALLMFSLGLLLNVVALGSTFLWQTAD